MRIFKIIITLLLLSNITLGQEYIHSEDENWLKHFDGEYSKFDPRMIYRLDDYNKEDIPKAKQKLEEVKRIQPKNEWEGIYYQDTGIGDRMMIWNAENGYMSFYHYHELRSLDYGKTKNTEDSIKFISDKHSKSKKNVKQANEKFIKIKFGERHFLVPENFIEKFLGMAAGTEDVLIGFLPYWTKQDDMRKEGFGIPIVPAKYIQFVRYPIEVEIIDIGERKIISNSQSTDKYNFDDIHYFVTIDAGKDKNIKTEMDFFVQELNQWIRIEKVFSKTAIGYFRRNFDLEGEEQCWDGEGGSNQPTPCKEVKIGMKATTKSSL